MYKNAWCTCKVVVSKAFLPLSVTSQSSLLKLPTVIWRSSSFYYACTTGFSANVVVAETSYEILEVLIKITVLIFHEKKQKLKWSFPGCLFLRIREKTWKSNLVLVVVRVHESKGLLFLGLFVSVFKNLLLLLFILFTLGMNCSLMLLQSQKHSCGLVDKVTCGELGCCWNESEANSHLKCFSKR